MSYFNSDLKTNSSSNLIDFDESLILKNGKELDINLPFNAYSTVNFNSILLKNRFCFIGKSDKIFFSKNFELIKSYFDYYLNIAGSGVGTIFTGGLPTLISNDKQNKALNALTENQEEFKNFISEIHLCGSKIFYTLKSCYGRADSKHSALGVFNYSASFNNNYNNSNFLCKKMGDGMCSKLIDLLASQAIFATKLGFDGIMIEGDLFSIIGEFSSYELNRRKIGYYLEIDDFSKNLLNKILSKNKIAKIFYSFSLKTFIKEIYGNSLNDVSTLKHFKTNIDFHKIMQVLVKLVKLGVDGFILKAGTYETEFLSVSTSFQNDNIMKEIFAYVNNYFKENQIKNKFGNDVFFVYHDFMYSIPNEVSENDNFLFDFTRQILADNKVLKKLQDSSTFMNCIKCGYCDSNISENGSTTCILCPNSDMKKNSNVIKLEQREYDISILKDNISHNESKKKTDIIQADKKIAVVGGGLSGINSAIYLLKRGFSVDLYEKQSILNKTERLCEIYGYNYLLKNYNDYIEKELNNFLSTGKLNIFLNTIFDINNIDMEKYSKIIVATGFFSRFSSIPGSVLKNVKNIYEVLENQNIFKGKDKIVIEAKSELSFKLAQYLLLKGKKVTILLTSVDFLLNMENSKLTYFLYSFGKLKCNVLVLPKIKRIESDFIELLINSKLIKYDFKAIILNLKSKKKFTIQERAKNIDLDLFIYEPEIYSNNKLYIDIVTSKFKGEVFSVGCSLYPCDFRECIKSAFFVSKNI